MLDLLGLETFRTVAATGNFTRAAAQLGCSQSTVTTRMQLLERQLSVRLFERCRFSRNVSLTDAGHRTLHYAGRILMLASQMKAAVETEAPSPVSAGK